MLDFRRLQSQLRRTVSKCISSGQISGSRLARTANFKECHVSNFLHERRGLSVEGMDRVLHVLGISVLDLIPRHVIERFAIANYDPEYETVPLVDASALHLPQPPNSVIHEHIKFKRSYLQRYRQGTTEDRKKWLRFVWMRTNETDVEAMYPRISHGSALLIDRHYTSLLPHSSADVSMYVVRTADRVVIRSFEVREREILLRAENPRVPIEFLPIDPKGRYTEKIIGRVCHVAYDAG